MVEAEWFQEWERLFPPQKLNLKSNEVMAV
jgi:hypothetical protein